MLERKVEGSYFVLKLFCIKIERGTCEEIFR